MCALEIGWSEQYYGQDREPIPGLVNQLCTDPLFTKHGTNLSGPSPGSLPAPAWSSCTAQHCVLAAWCFVPSVREAWLGSEGRVFSLQPVGCGVIQRNEWSYSGLCQAQNKRQASLCTTSLDLPGLLKNIDFCSLGTLAELRPCPYFLTAAAISKLWGLRLFPIPHVYGDILRAVTISLSWNDSLVLKCQHH